MDRWWGLLVVACLGVALAVSHSGAVVPPANPEDGKVAAGKYTKEYFKITYPLPSGWGEDRDGLAPSYSGCYVLTALKSDARRTGTMLIVAHDEFFAAEPLNRAAEMVAQFRDRISGIDGMTIDHGPSEIAIAGRRFTSLDYSGVGLFRAMLVTDSRCHFVSFNLTTVDPDGRASLEQSLNDLSMGEPGDRAHSIPVCVKDYATSEHVIARVHPTPAGPRFTSVPVRIVIGTDGRVRHVHVIRGSPGQRENITAALTRWQFKPFTMAGRPVEVETGVTFRF
jgi:hypothetical protein